MNTEVLVWLAAIAALFAASWVFGRLSRASIHAQMFTQVLVKILRANNLDRAIKLCMAGANAPLCQGTRAALEFVKRGGADPSGDDFTGGLRARGGLTPALAAQRLRACFEERFRAALAQSRAGVVLAELFVGACVAVVVVWMSAVPRHEPVWLAGAGALAVGYCHVRFARLERQGFDAFEGMRDAMVALLLAPPETGGETPSPTR